MRRAIVAPGLVSVLIAAAALIAPAALSAQSPPPGDQPAAIGESALRQIQALAAEKESRSPTQRKIDSQLLYGAKQRQGQRVARDVEALDVSLIDDKDGRVLVDIKVHDTKPVVKRIESVGGAVLNVVPSERAVRAAVPYAALEAVAELSEVRFIYPADRAITHRGIVSGAIAPHASASQPHARTSPRVDFHARAARVRERLLRVLRPPAFSAAASLLAGDVVSEGDTTHGAANARAFFGVTGVGVRIGVLSDGVDALADLQDAGELPAVTVLPGQAGGGSEGTAMLEIIHDLAPGAQLFFATALPSQAQFAQNIRDLRTAGCDIIVDDILFFREAVFQDDNVARAVNDVTAAGALYFSSAGNEGNKNENEEGVWEGDFVDGGTLTVGAVTLPGRVHDFGGGVVGNQLVVGNGGGAPIGLFWSDPLGGSGNDYDLFILNAAMTAVINASTNIQDGDDDPVELSTISPAATRRMVILKRASALTRALHLNTFRGILAIGTDGQTHGHSAAAAAFGVAATPSGPVVFPGGPTGPFPGLHSGANEVETFSSDGPRRVFFNPDGTPITPGNVLFGTGGGTLRQKPDITAADGVSVATPGFNPFFGTSAAAPHAAAIAALIKSAVPGLTTAQIRTALVSTAIDIEAAGVDRDSGHGIVMPFEALQSVGAVPRPFLTSNGVAVIEAESCPPANGTADPGERITVRLTLQNIGGAPTTNAIATLAASPEVLQPSGPQSFGAIPVDGSASRTFSFTAAGACGSTITLSLSVTDGSQTFGPFELDVRLGTPGTDLTAANTTPVITPIDTPAAGDGAGPATPYPSTIDVSGAPAGIGKVTVTLNQLEHTFPDDLDILLVGPGGQSVLLMSDVGGSANASGVTLTFDDDAAATLPDESLLTSGTFKPTNFGSPDPFPAPAPAGPYGSALSVFNGTDVNGTWRLFVFDAFTVDDGSLAGGWTVTFTPFVCSSTCATVRLVTSTALRRDPSGEVIVEVTVANTGSTAAANVQIASATLGTTSAITLPVSLGSIPAGGSATGTLRFPASVGPAGTSTTFRLGGTYTGGTFANSRRVVLP